MIKANPEEAVVEIVVVEADVAMHPIPQRMLFVLLANVKGYISQINAPAS